MLVIRNKKGFFFWGWTTAKERESRGEGWKEKGGENEETRWASIYWKKKYRCLKIPGVIFISICALSIKYVKTVK